MDMQVMYLVVLTLLTLLQSYIAALGLSDHFSKCPEKKMAFIFTHCYLACSRAHQSDYQKKECIYFYCQVLIVFFVYDTTN